VVCCVQTDAYCFLFTDMFLVTKPATKRGEKVKVIKPPMRLDKIIICGLRDVGTSTELTMFIIFTIFTITACIFSYSLSISF